MTPEPQQVPLYHEGFHLGLVSARGNQLTDVDIGSYVAIAGGIDPENPDLRNIRQYDSVASESNRYRFRENSGW